MPRHDAWLYEIVRLARDDGCWMPAALVVVVLLTALVLLAYVLIEVSHDLD